MATRRRDFHFWTIFTHERIGSNSSPSSTNFRPSCRLTTPSAPENDIPLQKGQLSDEA